MRPRLFPLARVIMRAVSVLMPTIVPLSAQQPIHVAYACPEEDLQFAGLSCTDDEACTIYLELSAVVAEGKKIAAAGDLHSASATLGSILLLSDDSGATWKEPAARIRGAALDLLQFNNPQTGWAAGETQYPLPRDPFFFLTTDGGATWRQTFVGEDGSAGAVQRFWFDSAQHGEAIVDAGKASASGRYLTYESENGGESWTLTGKRDQPPKLTHAPPVGDNSDWRLSPSKDGKAFLIERRADAQWKPVASFLIEVASCRSHTEELKEPSPPDDDTPPPGKKK
jgi:photosystem II stability/assembly factor-like uncharacterized protein